MSKYANPGELRTPVYFMNLEKTDDGGYDILSVGTNVFGDDGTENGPRVYCKWVNAHGTEVFSAMELQLREPATLTMRYSPAIHPGLLVLKAGDDKPYEIISVDNVDELNRWLEIKVQRWVKAR